MRKLDYNGSESDKPDGCTTSSLDIRLSVTRSTSSKPLIFNIQQNSYVRHFMADTGTAKPRVGLLE